MTIDQVSVFVENHPGRLAKVTRILGDAGIDLRALSIADTADFGILRIITSNPQLTLDLLNEAGCVVSVTQVIAVPIEDKPGSLASVLTTLADANISVEYAYAFITRKQDKAYVIFRVEDNDRAIGILAESGVKTVWMSELFDL